MENLSLFLFEYCSIFKCKKYGSFTFRILMQVFAMPETALGHFPDVGASYFLSRLPGFYGYHSSLFS